ncbi:DEHA2G24244p [Debaryomyces hansenii CBS767]|uniref:DEHA2G24244p n=1 Tax=Debaryomyces hansenii (strain ATCC 36239 / CBS 767 / BCRC 21394 / JCM 1990 / NBRC 0083 / IGC 2968) TaxID=284592 RepID=Q6BGS8_DEBHA|nr:DEHA2G24244p [Debaryomyces hansenii CBS767]CAG91108.2 DEHA2G24244p [Debaryomyces hansenii CBS767]|eukprot:XP_462593.2 DEHA2G24244p [Debaryomyces hansenii CBS767]
MSGILKWMVPLTILSYIIYVVNFICPQQSSSIFVNNLTCESYAYIKPSIDPFTTIVTTKSREISSSLHIDHVVSQMSHKAGELSTTLEPWSTQITEKSHELVRKLSVGVAPIISLVESAIFEIKIRIAPKLIIWIDKIKICTHVRFIRSWEFVKFKADLVWIKLSFKANDIFSNQIKPFMKIYLIRIKNSSSYLILKHYFHEYKLDVVVNSISRSYKSLMDVNSFQEKSDFLKKEFKNLMHMKTPSVPQGNDEEVAEVVKDILEEITSPIISSTVNSNSVSIDPTISSSPADSSLEDSDSDSDEPITISLTSTRYVTLETQTNEPSLVDNSISRKIEEEMNYWENKVNKTLNSALRNLSKDMSIVVNSSIDMIKPKLSERFTQIQQTNYKHYQGLNIMINAIDKDSAQIQEENRIIESSDDSSRQYVSRQDMRDKISESLTYCESEIKEIKEYMTKNHHDVLREYFKEIQDTIDVLESFAELTIQEFSNRLHALITMLEDEQEFDEAITWKSWKRFHKIKQDIFNARDLLFNQANDYQDDFTIDVVPAGLEKWSMYMKNVYFHANFLTNDNEEYLKLVRAKANVAFQLREGLIDKLEEAIKSGSQDSHQSSTIEESTTQTTEDEQAATFSSPENPLEDDESEGSRSDYESGQDSDGTDLESDDQD